MIPTRSRAKIETLTPQFLVLDLERACAFYHEKLGFETEFIYSDFYAGVQRDGVTIHLKLSDDPDPSRAFKQENEHLDVYITTDHVDDLYQEFQDRNTPFLKPLHATDWGTREFAVRDVDGYLLYFGQKS